MKSQLAVCILLAAASTMAQQGNSNRQSMSAAEMIAKLDKDNDGKISKTEFNGPDEHFTMFDSNNDGYISESEVPSGPPQQQQQGQQDQTQQSGQQGRPGGQNESASTFVTRLDKDGDGKVSKTEFDGPADHFTQCDTNKDGYLSSDEAPSGPPQQGGRR
jgi:Ca2+-binding EF-hand superfamily protein